MVLSYRVIIGNILWSGKILRPIVQPRYERVIFLLYGAQRLARIAANLRIFIHELSHVCHNRSLVRPVHIDILKASKLRVTPFFYKSRMVSRLRTSGSRSLEIPKSCSATVNAVSKRSRLLANRIVARSTKFERIVLIMFRNRTPSLQLGPKSWTSKAPSLRVMKISYDV